MSFGAVEIVRLNEDGEPILDEEMLEKCLNNYKVRNMEVCLISIAGAFRKGKSFIMNFLLRYLKREGYENENWIGSKKEELSEGFDWRPGKEPCTNGILMSAEPFLIEQHEKKIAVFLLDTQGLFDNKSDKNHNTLIFAMSTLMSSVQILNVSQQIQENDLEFLQYFTEYALACSKEKGREESQDTDKPFQRLIFLVRDWQDEIAHDYGMVGGRDYLREVMKNESKNKELEFVRKHMKLSFSEIDCCLLPYPGNAVAVNKKGETFSGQLKDIDEDFLDLITPFIESVAHPRNLKIKTINGQPVQCFTLYHYLLCCSKTLKAGSLPNPKNLMMFTAEAQNFEASRVCAEQYHSNMEKVDDGLTLDEIDLEKKHKENEQIALEMYAQKTTFGPKEIQIKFKEQLKKAIDENFNFLKTKLAEKKERMHVQMKIIVWNLTKMYEREMDKALEGSEPKSDRELSQINEKKSRAVKEQLELKGKECPTLLPEYRNILEDGILAMFKLIQTENNQKREAKETKNIQERTLKELKIKGLADYRRIMNRDLQVYTDPIDLNTRHKKLEKDMEREYDVKAHKIESLPEEVYQRFREIFLGEIQGEYSTFIDTNAKLKDQLLGVLRTRLNDLVTKYSEHFRQLLKQGYMRKVDLTYEHKKVKNDMMIKEKKELQAGSPLGEKIYSHSEYKAHIDLAESEMERQYIEVKDRNKTNKWWFQSR